MDEYISREETLKAFRLTAKNSNKDYQRGLQDAIDCLVPEVIAGIPAADVQPVNQWISVKDRLPDENQKCLVYRDIDADLKITTGIWHSEWKAFDGLRHGTRLEDTIAWMPLLEPPKDGDIE